MCLLYVVGCLACLAIGAVSYTDDVSMPTFEGDDDTLAFTQRDVDGKTINASAAGHRR